MLNFGSKLSGGKVRVQFPETSAKALSAMLLGSREATLTCEGKGMPS